MKGPRLVELDHKARIRRVAKMLCRELSDHATGLTFIVHKKKNGLDVFNVQSTIEDNDQLAKVLNQTAHHLRLP